MTDQYHRDALTAAMRLPFKSNEARELLRFILSGESRDQDADTLFRIVTLKEHWTPINAYDLYKIANQFICRKIDRDGLDTRLAKDAWSRWDRGS